MLKQKIGILESYKNSPSLSKLFADRLSSTLTTRLQSGETFNDNYNKLLVNHVVIRVVSFLWHHWPDGIVGFNVPLDTLQVISETILRVTWPNQQCHSTEGRWLVNQVTVKGQSHQAQLTKRYREGCKQKNLISIYSTMKTQTCLEDGELNQARSKARYSRPTCKNCSYLCAPL